jgi:dTDP-4-amino-4,6-dideoxygalactose transaminase
MKSFDYPVGSTFDSKEINIVKKILNSGETLTRGSWVDKFESEFKKLIKCKYAISTSSCGAALEISSKALNLKEGDEVICQSNNFWTAISHLLAKKVKIICCDINEQLGIDTHKLRRLITKKTKAIYLFHHGGNVIDVKTIKKIISNKVPIVEDCAHALGSKINEKYVGSDADIACFSFSSHKNISTFGEGGMITTNNKLYYEKIKLLKDTQIVGNYSEIKKKLINNSRIIKSQYFMPLGTNLKKNLLNFENIGANLKMSAIEAGVGIAQLKKLNDNNKHRNKIAKIYNDVLSKNKLCEIIKNSSNVYNSYHLFSFFLNLNVKKKNLLISLLNKKKICFKIRFSPINWYPLMRYNGCRVGGCEKCISLKFGEDIWLNKLFSLPISAKLKLKDARFIVKEFIKILERIK